MITHLKLGNLFPDAELPEHMNELVKFELVEDKLSLTARNIQNKTSISFRLVLGLVWY